MTVVGLMRIGLVFDTSGGVSDPHADGAVDLSLHRARDGAVWTPPSSLAGSLRAHLGADAERWLGSRPPRRGDPPLTPSRLRFLGTDTDLSAEVDIRRSTAIDPRRGAAATGTLRAAQVAPAGTTVTLYLRVDDASATELDGLTDLIASWRPVIGRGRSTGHGRARVTEVRWRQIDLATPAGVREWLLSGRAGLFPERGWTGGRAVPAPEPVDPYLALRFVIAGALHIGGGRSDRDDPAEPDNRDNRAPILTESGSVVIPATTWKGLLRSRCGYILRSCGRPACLPPAPKQAACRECMLCELFGWTGTSSRSGEPVGRVGRLATADSPVTGQVTHRNHVGIDRFTGGARRSLLFSDEVVESGEVVLQLSTTDPADRLGPAERGLLLLAVRDLHDGLVGVGRATTRGYGSLALAADSVGVLTELEPTHPTGAAVRALLTEEAR